VVSATVPTDARLAEAAFDRDCKSLQQFWSAPEIIANRIIAVAKNGERDATRLHEQVLTAFDIEEKPMAFVSVDTDLPVLAYASVTLQPA